MTTCDRCGHQHDCHDFVPDEPPVGTWIKDRYGAVSFRQECGGWGEPGIMPFGRWEPMWLARGPLVECGPWGSDLA